MKILVFGLGALGTVFATFLKEDGHEVYGITKEKYLKNIKSKPLEVIGIWGEHRASLDEISSNIQDFKDINFDLIILTVKSYDTKKAVKEIKPLIGKDTVVLVAQNGYGNYEIVSKEIGKEHTILGRVIFGSKIVEIGKAEVTVIADPTRIGQPENAIPEEKIRKIAEIIDKSGVPTKYDKNVYKLLWDKIIYNCALNPLGAILECNYGTLAENEETRTVMNKIIKEIFSVAKAQNIELNWKSPDEYIKHFYKNLIPPTAQHYPSMYHDLKSKKRLEIDALNGAIVNLAKEKNMEVPVNETITNLIKAKEKLI
jgi:2-dehydropantoate 2-reductase